MSKTLDQRVKEAINIKKQIQSLGEMIDEANEIKLQIINNNWIRTGESMSAELILHNSSENLSIRVIFDKTGRSGVLLIK